jgi:hypothetical protein
VCTHVVLLQGDLLVWLLSAAFAHDSTHSQAVLAHARARDELLMATMELRERAMALHLHIPHKFTLNMRRERVDVRASWAAVISKVEQVRDRGTIPPLTVSGRGKGHPCILYFQQVMCTVCIHKQSM